MNKKNQFIVGFGFLGIFFILGSLFLFLKKDTQEIMPVSEEFEKKEKLQIIASFYPIAFMAEEIGGDRINVINIAEAKDVHSYQPTPGDIAKMFDSNLVIFQGKGLELWTEDLPVQLEDKGVKTLSLFDQMDSVESISQEIIKVDDEDHSSHSDEKEASLEEEHNHGSFDPHMWLDPVLAQNMIDFIEKKFSEIDSEYASSYKKNAENLKNRFKEVDRKYAETLDVCQRNEVIVSHDAFRYIARRYGFTTHAIAGLSTMDEPSAKILTELKEEAREGITHILVEEGGLKRFSETLSLETGLSMLEINPLGRGPLDENKDFFDVLDSNLYSFSQALGCN